MTAPITPDERATMRALADAATPGPWDVVGPSNPGPDNDLAIVPRGEAGAVAYVQPLWGDAEFIAAARTAVPRLLDALDTAEAEVARLRATVSPAWDEEAVTEDVTVALRRLLPMTQEPALGETANVLAYAVLAAVRRHLPVSGEPRALVQAEALREAAEELDWPYDEIARLNSWEAVAVVLGALRARADRTEKGDTP